MDWEHEAKFLNEIIITTVLMSCYVSMPHYAYNLTSSNFLCSASICLGRSLWTIASYSTSFLTLEVSSTNPTFLVCVIVPFQDRPVCSPGRKIREFYFFRMDYCIIYVKLWCLCTPVNYLGKSCRTGFQYFQLGMSTTEVDIEVHYKL